MSDLKKELLKRREIFNERLKVFLDRGKPKVLYDAARHLPLAGGKRLRPVLSMVSCEAVNGDVETVIPVALAIELMHNFTLVHDDIMDKSNLRRNKPSVHVEYDEPTAINAGDLLFTLSFESMHQIKKDLTVFKELEYNLINTVREICEGQQLDMQFEKEKIIDEDSYLEMIRKKTAVLFEFSTMSGGLIGGGSKKEVSALKDYGRYLGLAFQIHDDYLDMSSDEEKLGKDIGNDIRNRKKTLIAVHCLNNAENEDRKVLDKYFGNKNASSEEVKKIYNVFKNTGSIDYAKKKAVQYHDIAREKLDFLSDSSVKEVLFDLIDFSISRKK
ncbi:MAG: polyprenyl synthetase family protein [Candidatus Thermoplasmatota archaeon]